jgi:RNA polymerase-binding protein DksA
LAKKLTKSPAKAPPKAKRAVAKPKAAAPSKAKPKQPPAKKPAPKAVEKKAADVKKVDAAKKPEPARKPEAPTKPDTSKKVDASRKVEAIKKPDTKPSSGKPAAKAVPEKAEKKIEPKPTEVAAAGDPKKPVRKGITIVSPKPAKKPKAKSSTPSPIAAIAGQLMGSGSPVRKPLIPSGPNAASVRPLGMQGEGEAGASATVGKSPFNKRELEKFRAILLQKRAELAGDVSTMEQGALQTGSGSLSNTPQHLAEQGSETYEQSLALDLAAAERKLIKEIDDALARIEAGNYGLCQLTGKPIKAERLEELPWARYSIEAARELERRSMRS